MYKEVITDALSPSSGPVLGGTRIDLFGSGFFNFPDQVCGFEPPSSSSASGHSPHAALRNSHPNGTVAASVRNGTLLRCHTPDANAAGVALELALGSLPECLHAPTAWPAPIHPAACKSLLGHALSHDSASSAAGGNDGSAGGSDGSGAALLTHASGQTGAAVLCPQTEHARQLEARRAFFEAAFRVETNAGDGRGDGFSFSFGPSPHRTLGASGTGAGLAVAFLEREAALVVSQDAVEVRRVPLPRWRGRMDCRVAFDADGLSVSEHSLGTLVSGLALHRWHPPTGWVVTVGASSGAGTSSYLISRFVVGFGAHMTSGAAAVKVSMNGQQFTRHDLEFTYYAPPVISSISPAHGPVGGGSRVVLSGRNFANGSHYQCDFGIASSSQEPGSVNSSRTAASYDSGSRTVACRTPVAAAGAAPLRLTLNGQQLSALSTTYTFQHPPIGHLSSIEP